LGNMWEDGIEVYAHKYTCDGESKSFQKSLDQYATNAELTYLLTEELYEDMGEGGVSVRQEVYKRQDTLWVKDLLYQTQNIITSRIEYEISMYVDANLSINPLPITEFSFMDKVVLSVNDSGMLYPPEAYVWEYRIGNGAIQEYPQRGKKLAISLNDLPNAHIGDPIFFHLKIRENDVSESVMFRFYPDLPHPRTYPSNLQSIRMNDTYLDTLRLEFNRMLNPSFDERITTITIYDSLTQFNNNGVSIAEARIVAQLLDLNITSFDQQGRYFIELKSKGIQLSAGKYYITAEGIINGRTTSVKASHNQSFTSERAQKAMFKLQEFKVVKNKMNVRMEITSPHCHNETGQFFIEIPNAKKFQPFTIYTFYKDGVLWEPTKHECLKGKYLQMYDQYTFTQIPVGTYNIKIISDEEISDTYLFTLEILNPPAISTSLNYAHISGVQYKNGIPESAKDGYLSIDKAETKNGTPPYTYTYELNDINKGNMSEYTAIYTPTSYKIEIKDANNCKSILTGSIEQLKDTLRVQLLGSNPKCNASKDGVLIAKVNKMDNGQDKRTLYYFWEKEQCRLNENKFILQAQEQGVYKVIVKKANTRLISYDTCRLFNPQPLSVSSNIVHVKCKGNADGQIHIQASGGANVYRYSWNNGTYMRDLANVKAGNYTLMLSDTNACKIEQTYTITEPALNLQMDTVVIQHPYYKTATNLEKGSIASAPMGGTPPYRFAWTPSSSQQNLVNLDAGKYDLQMSDANGCLYNNTYTLRTIAQVEPSVQSYIPPSCCDSKDAKLNLSVRGGRPPYQIQWSNGVQGESLQALSAGEYTATITDAFGASAQYNMQIKAPKVLQIINETLVQPSYYGSTQAEIKKSLSDASIQVKVEGGTFPYVYSWYKMNAMGAFDKLGINTERIIELSPGIYRIQISDQNACEIQKEYKIEDRQMLLAKIKVEDSVSCFGESNAILQAEVSGGVLPYTYHWSKENSSWTHSSSKCTGLSKGIYHLIVSDALGIQSFYQVQLNEPQQLRVFSKSIKDPDYYGSVDGVVLPSLHNGRILLNVVGGNGMYTYQWSHQSYVELGAEGMLMQNLKGDTYITRIKDKRNCQIEDTTLLVGYPSLQTTIIETNSIQCYGSAEGALKVKVQGGKAPYKYEWSNASSQASISQLPTSYYVITVTDTNGVKSSYTYFLSQPSKMQIHIEVQASPCAGDYKGSMHTQVQGGTLPYTFLWSNGLTSPHVEGLEAQDLQLEVCDANNCKSYAKASVIAPIPLSLMADTMNPSYQGTLYKINPPAMSNGLIALRASGGTAPYSYLWSGGETTPNLENLKENKYSVLLQDSNHCQLQRSFYLRSLPNLTANLKIVKPIQCLGDANGILRVQTQGGLPPYTYQWLGSQNRQDTFHQAKKGYYTVNVFDKNGISSIDSIFLDEPQALSILLTADSVSGWGASDGALFAACTGGTLPYTYHWSNGDSTSSIDKLKAGVYTLRVKDKNACLLSKQKEVFTPDSLRLIAQIKHCTYFGATQGKTPSPVTDGQIVVSVQGGVPPYTYQWANFSKKLDTMDSLPQGYYYLKVTDAKGYHLRDTFYIYKTQALCAYIDLKKQISCAGDSNGQLASRIEGGTPPYEYQWREGIKDSIRFSLAKGFYSLEVKDAKGIISVVSYFLDEPKALDLHLRVDSALGFGRCDGRIEAQVLGGTPPYSYLWSNAKKSYFIDSLCALSYFVSVQDSLLCRAYKETNVYAPDPLSIQAEIKHCDYFGADNGKYKNALNNGYIKVHIKGGVPPYQYLWESGQRQASIFGLVDTLYTLIVVDKNGNFLKDSFRIHKPSTLMADIEIKNPIKCNGDSLGVLVAKVSGGCPPYRYQWQNGHSDSIFTHAFAGWYTVKIYDRLGIVSTKTIYVSQPAIFKVYAQADSLTGADRQDGALRAWAV
ncbi:MAG: SprB repeat-containing protein, partial [Bacteroidales bacterium]